MKTTTSGYQQLVGWGDGNNFGTDFDVRLSGTSQISINVFSAQTNPYINLPYSVANGQWHQIILTFDGGTFVVYLDGTRAGSTTYGALNTDRTIVTVGSGFQGTLDDVAVYSGVLSSSQASAHFLASGNSQVTPPATVSASAGTNVTSVSDATAVSFHTAMMLLPFNSTLPESSPRGNALGSSLKSPRAGGRKTTP